LETFQPLIITNTVSTKAKEKSEAASIICVALRRIKKFSVQSVTFLTCNTKVSRWNCCQDIQYADDSYTFLQSLETYTGIGTKLDHGPFGSLSSLLELWIQTVTAPCIDPKGFPIVLRAHKSLANVTIAEMFLLI
jgi:hypothetical protein